MRNRMPMMISVRTCTDATKSGSATRRRCSVARGPNAPSTCRKTESEYRVMDDLPVRIWQCAQAKQAPARDLEQRADEVEPLPARAGVGLPLRRVFKRREQGAAIEGQFDQRRHEHP